MSSKIESKRTTFTYILLQRLFKSKSVQDKTEPTTSILDKANYMRKEPQEKPIKHMATNSQTQKYHKNDSSFSEVFLELRLEEYNRYILLRDVCSDVSHSLCIISVCGQCVCSICLQEVVSLVMV